MSVTVLAPPTFPEEGRVPAPAELPAETADPTVAFYAALVASRLAEFTGPAVEVRR